MGWRSARACGPAGWGRGWTFSLGVAVLSGATAAQEPPVDELYRKYCSQCHGEAGDGQGIAAPFLQPKPRDFTSGKYKVRSTPTGALPTDDDLRRAIRQGLPYTAMPGFPDLSEQEVDRLVATLKGFSEDFQDPEAFAEPIDIPAPPPWSGASAEKGRDVYVNTGCVRCHGELGRGDGSSAPTLVDDWGDFIRAADLTKPWTFRGGGTRRDVYRTMSSGFAGTPMPGFEGQMSVEDRWLLVDYIAALGDRRTEAKYATFVRAVPSLTGLDLTKGAELFAGAPKAVFPIIGQVIEPGRRFHPAVDAVEVQAVYDNDEIAFLVSWHDMRAETSGRNAPDLEAPDLEGIEPEEGAEADSDDEGFWGEAEVEEETGDDFWGDEVVEEEDDFWGEADVAESGSAASDSEFSDAVALQFPATPPAGIRKPYFLFGDPQNPVEIWYADLARPTEAQLWSGRGSAALALEEREPPELSASFADGRWSVAFKRRRRGSGPRFAEGTFVPLAFSVWDGFSRERGNRRGVSSWYDVYVEPFERPSPVGPMLRAALGILGVELLVIVFVRRKVKRP